MRYALLLMACLCAAQEPGPFNQTILRLELEMMRQQAERMKYEQAKRNAALVVSQCEYNAVVDMDKLLHVRGETLAKTPGGSVDAKFSERVRKALDRYEKCGR
jgi:hypothetical protein